MRVEAQVVYRVGVAGDADGVAALHAESWRRHYRGAYSDAYLDGDLVTDRRAVWTGRMAQPREDQRTIVATEEGVLVGFVHIALGADAVWGALIDNLHVTAERKRGGIGSALLRAAGGVVAERRPSSGMYLWVLEQNVAAQRFYTAKGGVCVERADVTPPGGDPSRLTGQPSKLRYAWSEPALTLRPQE
jgi:ribosomal protein S18 acetylase RimI-like enzyme